MKKRKILIPGTLTTQTCLRIFLGDPVFEARQAPFDPKEHYDRPIRLKDGQVPEHDAIMDIIRAKFADPHAQKGDLDQFGTVLRSGIWRQGVIFAYQVVVTTTINDNRRKFGRDHQTTETTGTQSLLSKKVFIFGKIITKAKAKSLARWVRSQRRLDSTNRDHAGFQTRVVTLGTDTAVANIPRKSGQHLLKIGRTTFVPFSRKTMEFKPL